MQLQMKSNCVALSIIHKQIIQAKIKKLKLLDLLNVNHVHRSIFEDELAIHKVVTSPISKIDTSDFVFTTDLKRSYLIISLLETVIENHAAALTCAMSPSSSSLTALFIYGNSGFG